MTDRYTHNFRVLGVRPGASWKELRKAYKSLVNTWHPDRFQQNVNQRKLAEEKTKEITQCYQELAEYYKEFGVLPDMTKVEDRSVARDITSRGDQETPHEPGNENLEATDTDSAPVQAQKGRPSKPGARTWAVLTLAGLIYFAWQIMPGDRSDSPPQNLNSTDSADEAPKDDNSNQHAPVAEKYFTVGTSLGEVYAIQGVPTKTEQDVWYYGKSKVYFANGKVLRWEESPDNPLRVEIDPENGKMNAMFFGEGSSKDQVLAVQGPPDRDTGNVWDYGVSRVYFENNRVKGWDESPFNPLRVRP